MHSLQFLWDQAGSGVCGFGHAETERMWWQRHITPHKPSPTHTHTRTHTQVEARRWNITENNVWLAQNGCILCCENRTGLKHLLISSSLCIRLWIILNEKTYSILTLEQEITVRGWWTKPGRALDQEEIHEVLHKFSAYTWRTQNATLFFFTIMIIRNLDCQDSLFVWALVKGFGASAWQGKLESLCAALLLGLQPPSELHWAPLLSWPRLYLCGRFSLV